jgi:hypothetical protein
VVSVNGPTAENGLLRRQLAQAWFDGYSKGNLDGYFGTSDERKASPYADLDPYRDCGAGGPREATSDCVLTNGHDGDHRDDSGGTWPWPEQPRYTNPIPPVARPDDVFADGCVGIHQADRNPICADHLRPADDTPIPPGSGATPETDR